MSGGGDSMGRSSAPAASVSAAVEPAAIEEAWIVDDKDAARLIGQGWEVSGPCRMYQGHHVSVIVVRPIGGEDR